VLHRELLAGSARAVVRLVHEDDPTSSGLNWEPTPLQQLVVSMSRRNAATGTDARTDLEEVSR
jgi:hypothetical protein